MNITFLSFFAGAGFLDLGFEAAGFESLLVNEYHPPFLAAHQYSRKRLGLPQPKFGYSDSSITSYLEKESEQTLAAILESARADGRLVGFVGGPPCPDFSVGGKNRGRHGENGKLSSTYVSLIVKQRPDFFLFENVKGLWKTKRHREFYEELKMKLWSAGYFLSDRLINCIWFGAPQDRERVFLFGVRSDLLRTDNDQFVRQKFDWVKRAIPEGLGALTVKWPSTSPFCEDSLSNPPNGIPLQLTVGHWFEKNAVEWHPNQLHCFAPRAGKAKFETVAEGDDSKKSYKRLHRWRYSPTACYGNNEVHLHPYKVRRITVAEALAIQSLPKDFELPPTMSLSDMFKTVGNGVPYVTAKAIAETVREFLVEHANPNHGIRSDQSHKRASEESCLQLH